MTEQTILTIALTAGALGFAAKGVATTALWWLMRKADDATALGPALKRQQGALAVQAFVVAAVFGYFASAIGGNGAWVPAPVRSVCYVVMAGLVIWAAIQCVRVVFAYFDGLGGTDGLS